MRTRTESMNGLNILKGEKDMKKLMTVLLAVMCLTACLLSSCKAWRTYTTTATYSVAPDKSGNPVTTIQTKTCEEYTGVKK